MTSKTDKLVAERGPFLQKGSCRRNTHWRIRQWKADSITQCWESVASGSRQEWPGIKAALIAQCWRAPRHQEAIEGDHKSPDCSSRDVSMTPALWRAGVPPEWTAVSSTSAGLRASRQWQCSMGGLQDTGGDGNTILQQVTRADGGTVESHAIG